MPKWPPSSPAYHVTNSYSTVKTQLKHHLLHDACPALFSQSLPSSHLWQGPCGLHLHISTSGQGPSVSHRPLDLMLKAQCHPRTRPLIPQDNKGLGVVSACGCSSRTPFRPLHPIFPSALASRFQPLPGRTTSSCVFSSSPGWLWALHWKPTATRRQGTCTGVQ